MNWSAALNRPNTSRPILDIRFMLAGTTDSMGVNMDITIVLSDSDFNSPQRRLVQETLGLNSEAELAEALKKLFKAAALEYVNMFVEKGMASRADEVRQDRLFFLITHLYQN